MPGSAAAGVRREETPEPDTNVDHAMSSSVDGRWAAAVAARATAAMITKNERARMIAASVRDLRRRSRVIGGSDGRDARGFTGRSEADA